MARSAVFLVSLSRPSADPVTVNYATVAGTASAGSDFTSVSGTITFAPGQTSAQVVVPIVEPADGEPQEQFTLALSSPVNATLANNSGTATIPQKNPNQFPVVSVADASGRTLTFTVTISPVHTVPCSISYSCKSITAIAGKDYTPTSGTLNFAVGETSKTVSVAVLAKSDRDLKLKLVLASPVNLTLFRLKTGVGTITPDSDVVSKVNAAKTARDAWVTAWQEYSAAWDARTKASEEYTKAWTDWSVASGEAATAAAEVAAATNNVSACQQALTNVTVMSVSNASFLPLVAAAQSNLNAANTTLTNANATLAAANTQVATALTEKDTKYTAFQTADTLVNTKKTATETTKAALDTAYATAKAAFVGSTTIDFTIDTERAPET